MVGFFQLGRPARLPREGQYVVASISDSDALHERLWRQVWRFVSTTGGEIPSGSRGRGRLAEVLREGAQRPYFQKDGCHSGLNNTVAKDVEPERISLPIVA